MLGLAETGNSSGENKTVFGFDTYALQLQDIVPSLFNGQTFAINRGSVEDAKETERNIQDSLLTSVMVIDILQTTASIQLPNNFFDSIKGCTNESSVGIRLSYSVFLTDILFQSELNQSVIGSIIVAARLGCADNTTLPNPIKVIFRTIKQVHSYLTLCQSIYFGYVQLNNTDVENGRCAIWNQETGTISNCI